MADSKFSLYPQNGFGAQGKFLFVGIDFGAYSRGEACGCGLGFETCGLKGVTITEGLWPGLTPVVPDVVAPPDDGGGEVDFGTHCPPTNV